MRSVVRVAFTQGIWESAHVLERKRIHGEAKTKTPVPVLVLKPAADEEEVTSHHTGCELPKPEALKLSETASPCLPITNMSSSLSNSGVTSPYLVKFPDDVAVEEKAW